MIIYKTTNLIDGKIYIGQNTNNNPNYFGSGLLLNRAIRKHGKLNFVKEIVEMCDTKDHMNEREKHWIAYYCSTNKKIGYNIAFGGTGGKTTDQEWKKGKTYEEAYGVVRAIQIKQKLSCSKKGRKLSPKNITRDEWNRKIAQGNKGRILTVEQKENLSRKNKNYFQTPSGLERRKQISIQQHGRIYSEESKKRNSITMKSNGYKPPKMKVHPSAFHWYFYNENNELVMETTEGYVKALKKLDSNIRRIKKFNSLIECFGYRFSKPKPYPRYKLYHTSIDDLIRKQKC